MGLVNFSSFGKVNLCIQTYMVLNSEIPHVVVSVSIQLCTRDLVQKACYRVMVGQLRV